MKPCTLLFCGAALTALAGGALAGEDSTHRYHGVGPAWYEVEGGLRRFAAGDPYEQNPRAEEARERAAEAASSKRMDRDASDTNARHGKQAAK
jgi:hypothetical protein